MSLVWIDGTLVEKSSARVNLFDHGFLFGDGVWEPLRVHQGRLAFVDGHLDNLFHSAEWQGIAIPLSREQLAAAIETTLRANDRTEGYVRVIVTRGPGTLGPDPRKLDPQVIIIAEEYRPFPAELAEHGLHAVTFPASRCEARLLGRPEIVAAKRHAIANGCLEAIFVDGADALLESTEGMILVVNEGEIAVAPGHLLDADGEGAVALARESGLKVSRRAVLKCELSGSSEVFVAGTSCGIVGITRIDGSDIGRGIVGPVTLQLREQMRALIRGIG